VNDTTRPAPPGVEPDEILVVRRGPGANCSSIGSALDILFLSAVAGGAILAGVAAAFPAAGPRASPASRAAGAPAPPGPAGADPQPEPSDARPR
jgi:hypothetical protein